MIYAATFGVTLIFWSLLFSQVSDTIKLFGGPSAGMILLSLTLVGWALSGGGLGLLINAARRRDVPHSKAKLGIGLALVSVLCAGVMLAMFISSRPSWEKAKEAWESNDQARQVIARRQLISLTYEHIHKRAPSSYTLRSVRAQIWGRLRPKHIETLDATQRALLKSYALKQIELCASNDKKLEMKQSDERWRERDCTQHVNTLRTIVGEDGPIHKYYLGELDRDLKRAENLQGVLLNASIWGRSAPAGLQADAAITGAFDRQLAAARAKAKGEMGQLQALDEALDKLKMASVAQERAPSLKSRAATLSAERAELANQPGVGRSLAFVAYKLKKTHPRQVTVREDLVAFFDTSYLNAPVFLRLEQMSAKKLAVLKQLKPELAAKNAPPVASRTVIGALVAPSLEAKISKLSQGMPVAIQAVMGTTKNAAGKQVVRDTTARPDKANISAKINMGWASAGDFPLDEQMSALAWLADYAGVDGHLDAKVTKELKAKGYSGTRLTTWRTNNRTYAREHYANHGFYNGLVTGYVLRTATTPTYRSSSTYRSRYSPSRSSYRSSSPSTYRSSSPSYRSSSSSYRSRYSSSSSRSSSRSGGYRSGK